MKKTIIAFALTILLPFSAMAHSPLKSTSPADKAELKSIPPGITMIFGKAARITKVTLTHASGDNSHTDKLDLPSKKFEEKFELMPQFRGNGSYKVDWRALSKDGHPLKGSFSFSVTE